MGAVELRPGIDVDLDALSSICARHHIDRVAVFGSSLRTDFGDDSDIDLLVAFEPGQTPGLLEVAVLELELAPLFAGREVEVRTAEDLSPLFRDEVQREARPLYVAA
jgi:predicted nucleotidyltransferase